LIVLDASFLVKLVLEENGSDKARELTRIWARNREVMATIDLALPETLNAIWKHSRKIGDLDIDEAFESARDLLKLWVTLKVYSSEEVAGEAFKLAVKEDITVYDALYIQLARSMRAGLATFDDKLAGIAIKYGLAIHPGV